MRDNLTQDEITRLRNAFIEQATNPPPTAEETLILLNQRNQRNLEAFTATFTPAIAPFQQPVFQAPILQIPVIQVGFFRAPVEALLTSNLPKMTGRATLG